MHPLLYEYQGSLYPDYLKRGNACRFISPVAAQFCIGRGYDIGANKWPLPGAIPWDISTGGDAMQIPEPDGSLDFVFSSHCLEHLEDWRLALRHWISKVKPGGMVFLHLPHHSMKYWRPENCAKHKHALDGVDVGAELRLACDVVWVTGCDLSWSFQAVGFKRET